MCTTPCPCLPRCILTICYTVHSSSPSSFDGNSFAPPSSLQRSDSRNNSKLILQKDKLIESLRLELAEAQIKLVESENQGGGRLQEVERSLMEARMANARLMEDNESYQLLLQEKTLKGDFGQNDFSYMGSNANQDALDALEGKGAGGDGGSVVGGSSLADELDEAADDTIVSTATEGAADTNGAGEADRRQETELRSLREQNKALTLYINKIIERLLQHQDFESILDQSGDMNPPTLPRPTSGTAPANTSKDLPPPPPPASDKPGAAASFLQRAKSIAGGPNGNTGSAGGYGTRTSSLGNQRPMSYMPSSSSGHTDPDTAPSIPIGNLTRTASKRQSRPRSEQFTGAASLVSQMYKGGAEGPASPTLGGHRHSQSFFAAPGGAGVAGGNPNAAAAARVPSGSSSQPPSSSGNFPGMRSETSSVSGESVGDLSTPPSQSPPRSHSDKGTTFAGGKPRPLRLVQENNPDATSKENKRSSWISGWGNWGKKDSNAGLEQETASIPE